MSKDPLRTMKCPEALPARVVEAGDRPRLHGYDVEADLCRHYGFAETTLLALTGELPGEKEARLFERLLVLLSPSYAGAASVHAASLSRICGGSDSALLATFAGVLADSVGSGEASHLAWEEESLNAALAGLMREMGLQPSWGEGDPAFKAVSGALGACGLASGWQQTAALTIAALPAAIAEAQSWDRGALKDYPVELPPFRYEED